MKKKMTINGYYFDGESLWIIYVDEDGRSIMKKDKS